MFNEITLTDSLGNTITNLNQWDNDITVRIPTDSLSDTVSSNLSKIEVHFCNRKSEKALNVKPSSTSTYLSVLIPNSLLRESYNIIMYLYYRNDSVGQTLYTIEIPVRKRPQPSDYIYSDDSTLVNISEIEQQVKSLLGRAELLANQLENIPDLSDYYTKSQTDDTVNLKLQPVQEKVNSLKETVDNLSPEWKLLATIDLSESQLGSYVISKSDDGETFECERIRIVAKDVLGTNGANWGASVRTTTNSASAGQAGGVLGGNVISDTMAKTIFTDIEAQVGSNAVNSVVMIRNNSNYSDCAVKRAVYTKSFYVGLINYIQVYASSTNVFTAGTIEIYGKVK